MGEKIVYYFNRTLARIASLLPCLHFAQKPYHSFFIHPNHIQYTPGNHMRKEIRRMHSLFGHHGGLIRGGDWDQEILLLKEMPVYQEVYQAFEERFFKNKQWEEITYYQNVLKSIQRGKTYKGCKRKKDWKDRIKGYDGLFKNIRDEGYLSQRELKTKRPWDELQVAIDGEGRPLFIDGKHRLAMAHLLQLDQIPVIISCYQQKWYEMKGPLLTPIQK